MSCRFITPKQGGSASSRPPLDCEIVMLYYLDVNYAKGFGSVKPLGYGGFSEIEATKGKCRYMATRAGFLPSPLMLVNSATENYWVDKRLIKRL